MESAPLFDRLLARLTASPRFRRWAFRTPGVASVARARGRAAFDLCAGFAYSQVLLACSRLRLFEALRAGPAATGDLAVRLDLPVAATERLLRAAASLALVAAHGDRWRLASLGASLLDAPGERAMIEHGAVAYPDLADPVALLRGEASPGALARFWTYAGGGRAPDAAQAAAYGAPMAASQAFIAQDVLDAVDLRRARRLLDIGGGEGAFLCAAAARHSHLHVILLDLPEVAARARIRFADAGLGGRADAVGADLRDEIAPPAADAVSLVRVLHDHDDAEALAILRVARAALPPGGLLVVAEPMSGVRGAERVADAYFGFYLLAMGSGRARTLAEHRDLMLAAGFDRVRRLRTARPFLTSVLVARAA
ncbi:MAG: methyltransferase domain-containing protein [Caulobacteraceae bacterium]|nr:methyltransferase domain-containing protein [Caulobacter sp.]